MTVYVLFFTTITIIMSYDLLEEPQDDSWFPDDGWSEINIYCLGNCNTCSVFTRAHIVFEAYFVYRYQLSVCKQYATQQWARMQLQRQINRG